MLQELPLEVARQYIPDEELLRRTFETYQMPVIIPPAPAPFIWDPTTQSWQELEIWVNHLCNQLRDAIVAQVSWYAHHIRATGWVSPLPADFDQAPPPEMETARLLYLRVVKGLSWKELAREAGQSVSAVRKRVKEAAELADVPLKRPKGRRGP